MAVCTVLTVKEAVEPPVTEPPVVDKVKPPICDVGYVYDETLQACIPEFLAKEHYGIKVWQWFIIAGAGGIILALLRR